MNYETIHYQSNYDTFSKLKYGFEKKDKKLTNFKNSIKSNKTYQLGNKQKLENLLKTDVKELIKTSIPNSFALQVNFTLKAPYYSSDDDEFYIIQNPCLKEKVFKVPMVRGSSIKGALIDSAREIIKNKSANSDKVKALESYFRIFGVGDNEFREVLKELNDNNIKLFFMLNGLAINVKDNVEDIFKKYKESKAQKGRAIFYPIYFNKLSLELINPHNRKTKAGTNPIHYEVVPKGSSSQLQIVYIPYDGIMEKSSKIEKEAKQDIDFLKACIKKALDSGIGAKTKLGWGKANINGDIKEFWSKR